MENWLLSAAAVLAACAAAAGFIPQAGRKLYVILWSTAAALVFTALGLMVSHLLGSRFEYRYVYGHTDRGLYALYKVSALWSGQEGSLLLWAAVFAATGFAPMLSTRAQARRVFGVYASIAACIFILCFATQPFSKIPEVPPDGLGLAAALQDPWMAAHPPIVFAAYSTMAVLAAKAAGRAEETAVIARISFRKWALISWVLLGLGIFTGCIWAYRALGWGGYWSWDPIENAAIAPWLVLGGSLHGAGKAGRVKLVLPFTLACLGTFLARSGLLAERSAHAYASGNLFVSVAFAAAILAVLCWLIYCCIRKTAGSKKKRITGGPDSGRKPGAPPMEWAFYLCAGLILAGTLAPLALNIDTPKAYYNAVAAAFALACTVLLLLREREALRRRNLPMMLLAAALALGAAFAAGNAGIVCMLLLWIILMPLALWIVCGIRAGERNWKHILLHAGAVLLIAGAIISTGLGKDAYTVLQADGSLTVGGKAVRQADMAGRDAVIISSPAGDTIIECAGAFPLPGGRTAVPCSTRPLVIVFWAGGFATALGPCVVFIIQRALLSIRP